MVRFVDFTTFVSSLALRLSAYVFLRWIPGHQFPPIIYTFLLIYIPSLLISAASTSPFNLLADKIDIKVTRGEDSSKITEISTLRGEDNLPRGTETVELEETVLLQSKGSRPLTTLLTGLPSPTSTLLTLITALLNVLLVVFVLDVVYRGPIRHPGHDLSFARIGHVSDTSAKVMLREGNTSRLPLYLSYRNVDDEADDAWKAAGTIHDLTNETDFTWSGTISQLRPDTKYQYTTSSNSSGFFRTASRPGHISRSGNGKFTFLTSSCIKARVPYNPLSHPLSIPGFASLARRLPGLQAQFMLFLGDFIYVDVPKRFGSDIETYRREYRMVYGAPEWESVSKELPWIHVIDDHDIANDWDRNTTGVYAAAIEPWAHYQSSVNPPKFRKDASYFSFTQGPASFFLMDTRRYRSPEAGASFTAPDKTMLGKQQLDDLLAWLREPVPPGVGWKIVASSVPFTKNWRFNDQDTWAGYQAERQRILEGMWDVGLRGGVGVVIVSGDRHEFAATSFPPPAGGEWPLSATVHEFSTSPLSQFYLPKRTYRQEDDEDVMIKYLPDGNSKFGAIEITSSSLGEQGLLKFRLFVDGEETWNHVITTPPNVAGAKRAKDALWN